MYIAGFKTLYSEQADLQMICVPALPCIRSFDLVSMDMCERVSFSNAIYVNFSCFFLECNYCGCHRIYSQVLPLHLAKRGSPQRSHSASSQAAPSPVHVRAGSSPAKVHYTPPPLTPPLVGGPQQEQSQPPQHHKQSSFGAACSPSTSSTTSSCSNSAVAGMPVEAHSGAAPSVGSAMDPLGISPLLIRANTIDDSTALHSMQRAPFDDEKEIFC